jgi:hypothetical protein
METLEELLRNPAYRHVVLNHFPITGLLLAWVVLLVGVVRRDRSISLLGLLLVAVTAGSAVFVMSAGEDAYPRIREGLDAAGRLRLDRHADLAGFWGLGLYATGAVAIAAFVLSWWRQQLTTASSTVVAVVAFVSLVAVVVIAEAGGRIRHAELHASPAVASTGPPSGGPVAMRRLSPSQYREALVDVFGDGIEVVGTLEPDTRRAGLLAVGSAQLTITPAALEVYEAIATSVASQVLGAERRERAVPCTPASPSGADDSCAVRFIRETGEKLFRRPLDEAEVAARVQVAATIATQRQDFYVGLQVALESLLVSPEFLFRIERTEPVADEQRRVRLSDETLAMRLSYFLWNDAPDDELLAVAARGQLHDPATLTQQVDRLLASPRVADGARAFFADLLHFDEFDALNKDVARYPMYSRQIADDAREQTLRGIVDHVIDRQQDYRDLFVTRRFFMTRSLGPVYRVPVRTAQGWEEFDFADDDPRAGLLSHASLAMLNAHPGKTSPTLRGKYLREVFLCQSVPAAPANVPLALFNDDTNPELKTARDRLAVHSTNASCRGCHKMIDPAGLALERFDGIGAYRTTENDASIDASGDLDGSSFADGAELGQVVREHPQLPRCFVQTLYRYAVGREEVPSERGTLDALNRSFADSGFRVPVLLREIALSETFRTAPSDTAPADAPAQQARTADPPPGGAS